MEDTNLLVDAINQYGFPIIAACAMGYFIYFVWKWVTEEIDPVVGSAMGTLIGLVDRVRMLDNDMIRLNQKLAMVLEYKEEIAKTNPDGSILLEIPVRNAMAFRSWLLGLRDHAVVVEPKEVLEDTIQWLTEIKGQ